MHDIDRALFETEEEGETFEGEFADNRELALAGELLEVTNEEELDQFLGKLLSGAVKAGRSFLASDAGKAVGGLLKSAAKTALPQVGQALGNYLVPGAGGAAGQRAGAFVGKTLGLEVEGMTAEDRQFETARGFVRFADEMARTAVAAPPTVPAAVAASRAATIAASRHLPGLVPVVQRLRPPGAGQGGPRRPRSGRWVRRGSSIVILNA
ncbi:hypothetical protein [Georgenia sp. SYP-B2076]|uniref:hypothetical protein n=1 Tax=Georgenia sp. SYP-B2076 TaxID=2495881 RepID=UPI000F8D5345|nr:hypothetical protein [Georgenia sp. SYP-B2076]